MKIGTMYATIAIIFFAIVAILGLIRSCSNDEYHPFIDYKIKSDRSFIIDSLKRIETVKLKKYSDSLISVHAIKDSIAGKKITTLEAGYKPLRALIKHLTSIRVDSLSQIVIVPVSEYNAFVESGNKCDSIQSLKNVRIAERDSIVSELRGQVKYEQDQNTTTQQALTDQAVLTRKEKLDGEKIKKINTVLIKIIVVETAILAIIAIII